MRPSVLRPLLFALAPVVLVVLAAVLYVLALREDLSPQNVLVRASLLVQLAFLGAVLLRYLLLLWFSFLSHLDTLHEELPPYEPFVSIMAPGYNEEKVIDEAVASLVALDYPAYEVVIIDDGSTDGTYARARAWAARPGRVPVRALTKPNGGKATALNHGIRHAKGEFVLCIDTDSVLSPDTLRVTARHFADPTVGAVAGNVKVVNRRNLITWLQALEYVEGLNMLRRAQAFFHLVNIVPGPLGLFRRRAVLEVGGYPHDTFAEDADLTLLLLEHGWKLRYEPRATSHTEAPEELIPLLKQRYRWTRGLLQAMRKRSHMLLGRGVSLQMRLTLFYMIFEGVLWPAANIMANLFLLGVALTFGFSRLLVLWWLQLTLLDVVAALFCIAMEDEDPRLLLVAPFYRIFYVLLIDVCKLLATIEDVFGLEMTWGKLERVGRLG
jgi:cellulose synthase/poly-beta-1,6-N-acetylglucosamine synthase-like glycosyltransferase